MLYGNLYTRTRALIEFGRAIASKDGRQLSKGDRIALHALFDFIEIALTDKSFEVYQAMLRLDENNIRKQLYDEMRKRWRLPAREDALQDNQKKTQLDLL